MDEVAGVLSMHLALLAVVNIVHVSILTVQLIDEETKLRILNQRIQQYEVLSKELKSNTTFSRISSG